jgi:hypothetical protein
LARCSSAPIGQVAQRAERIAHALCTAWSKCASSGSVARVAHARKRSALSLKCQYTAPRVMPAPSPLRRATCASRRARGTGAAPRRAALARCSASTLVFLTMSNLNPRPLFTNIRECM